VRERQDYGALQIGVSGFKQSRHLVATQFRIVVEQLQQNRELSGMAMTTICSCDVAAMAFQTSWAKRDCSTHFVVMMVKKKVFSSWLTSVLVSSAAPLALGRTPFAMPLLPI
jgi:hypothetical protein